MLREQWTAKRSDASVLADINEDKSVVHKLVLKMELTYFGGVVPSDGLEKTFMFGMGNDRRSRG